VDKDTLVSQQTESGSQLISALAADGFDIEVAFWAKPTEEGKWYLYLASPVVDQDGPAAAYRRVHNVLRKTQIPRIDPLEVRVVGLNDSLAKEAMAVVKPGGTGSPYAARNPGPYPGITLFRGDTLGGIDVDGAIVYAPAYGAPRPVPAPH
jgi:hypothetical protein